MTVPCVIGTAYHDVRWGLESVAGAEAVERALASLSEEERRTLHEATVLSWVPLATVGVLVDTTAFEAGLEPEAMLDEAVRRATARTFKTVWRVFLRFTSDAALVRRTPALYARSRNVGKLEVLTVDPGRAELVLSGWPDITDRHIRTLAVNIETVVGLAGRRDAKCRGERARDGARYELTWAT